jgi:peptidylprolyl isomerase
LVLIMIAVVACGPAGNEENEDDGTENSSNETAGEVITTASGLQVEIVEPGTGDPPALGDQVSVHYTGSLEDGTVFDSSEGGDPFTFPLGEGRVIPGWDEGIALLSEGTKAKLTIPPELGYGETGAGSQIPPNATLIFDVELVNVIRPEPPQSVDESDYTVTDSGLKYYDFVEGDGEMPEEGKPVRIHYTVWLEDGTRLDSSLDRGQPLAYPAGQGQVLPGWDEGVLSMREGGQRQLVLPPDLAFGEASPGGNIPENATLIMEIELLEVLEGGPAAPPEYDEDDIVETESGLQYVILEEGSGAETTAGNMITAHYTGWLEDGTKFDSSLDRGESIQIPLGQGAVIPGWDEGLIGMQVGEVRLLIIPPDLAYGETGAGQQIPPNATLIFQVELLDTAEIGQ